ncbi:MAG: ABC1 kinase family protein [Anaerolineae bacterium]
MNNKSLSGWVLSPIVRRYRELLRLRDIARILARNGLDFLVQQLLILRFIPRRLLLKRWRVRPGVERMSVPVRVRRTLEELGPTFIKIGQMLAGRADVLPLAYQQEFSKLLNEAPPEDTDAIIAIVEGELGGSVDKLFAEFERQPLAAASLAQVHRARLHDGGLVAVKVQRPHIRETVQADLDLLRDQARFLEKRSALARERRLVELVDELAFGLLNELDFTFEARNAGQLRRNLRHLPFVLIPRVHSQLSTNRVLVTDYIEGIKLTDRERLLARGYDLKEIANLGVEMYVQMVFRDGFFHADPHPGNIWMVGEQIALVDFGTVGYLTAELREHLSDLLLAFMQQSPQQLATALVQMGSVRDYRDIAGLEQSLRRILLRYYGAQLSDITIGDVLTEVFSAALHHHVHIPADLALLAKTLVLLDGLARQLQPQFVLAEALRPHVQEMVRRHYSPRQVASETLEVAEQTRHLIRTLPRRAETLLELLERGDLKLGLDIQRLSDVIRRLNEMANRLSFAIVVAALLLGSSIILSAGAAAATWHVLGVAIPIGALSFVGAGFFGFWLLIAIIRSRGR